MQGASQERQIIKKIFHKKSRNVSAAIARTWWLAMTKIADSFLLKDKKVKQFNRILQHNIISARLMKILLKAKNLKRTEFKH